MNVDNLSSEISPGRQRILRMHGTVSVFGCACCVVLLSCGQSQSDTSFSQGSPGRDAATEIGGSGGGGGDILKDTGVPSGGAPNEPNEGGAAGETQADRPPAPPWQPYFALGAPGWRASVEPNCTELFGSMGQAIWSDETAVFALVSAECNSMARVPCGGQGTSLYRNDGTGWVLIHSFEMSSRFGNRTVGLSGFSGGDLLVTREHECGISQVSRDGSSSRCTWMFEPGLSMPIVRTFGARAYALTSNLVLQYDGVSQWDVLATLPVDPFLGASDLWVGRDSIVVAGPDQFVARVDLSGAVEVLPGVPAGDYWTVWGFDSEIWLGNTVGQLVRFDGVGWTTIDTGITGPIRSLWGSPEGDLYFRDENGDFGRWNGSAVELFAVDSGGSRIRFDEMWGNHTNEVFLSVIDSSLRNYECSGVFMVYFDGAEFHQF